MTEAETLLFKLNITTETISIGLEKSMVLLGKLGRAIEDNELDKFDFRRIADHFKDEEVIRAAIISSQIYDRLQENMRES